MKGHGRILREVERTLAGIPAVIRYKNIKNLYLRISGDGSRIELSVPRRTLMCDMEDFVRRRRAWIEARLRSMRAKRPPSLYAAGDIVHFWGSACHIVDAPLVHGKAYAESVGGMIVLHAAVDADAMMHELTHLWVRGHGAPFRAHMDRYLPDWRAIHRMLNAEGETELDS